MWRKIMKQMVTNTRRQFFPPLSNVRTCFNVKTFHMRVEGGLDCKEATRRLFGMMELFFVMVVVVTVQLCALVKTLRTVRHKE